MMIVAMRKSAIGKRYDDVKEFVGNPDHPLYESKLTNIIYCGEIPLNCSENKKAKHDIKSFLA